MVRTLVLTPFLQVKREFEEILNPEAFKEHHRERFVQEIVQTFNNIPPLERMTILRHVSSRVAEKTREDLQNIKREEEIEISRRREKLDLITSKLYEI